VKPVRQFPKSPGAYALLIDLPVRARLSIATLKQPVLAAGRYVYCGSARGPGGLGARLGRHLRRDKKPHWHVDHLTAVGAVLDVCCLEDGHECEMVRCLVQVPGVTMPVAGFGASDCRRCFAHLLKVPSEFALSSCWFT